MALVELISMQGLSWGDHANIYGAPQYGGLGVGIDGVVHVSRCHLDRVPTYSTRPWYTLQSLRGIA